MEPVFFVMAILGCGDDGVQCRQARVDPVQYTSIAACKEAMPAVLMRNTDIDYPVVGAQCKAQGQQIARLSKPARPGRG